MDTHFTNKVIQNGEICFECEIENNSIYATFEMQKINIKTKLEIVYLDKNNINLCINQR